MKQDWINNTEDGREIYEILDANLPTIEAGGTVTEEQIWNCVNLLLERETKVKNLAQPDVSGSISYGDIIENTSKDMDCCSQCKYKEFNGEHNACFLCANDDIGINYYFR